MLQTLVGVVCLTMKTPSEIQFLRWSLSKCVADGQAVTAGCHKEVGWLVVAKPTAYNYKQEKHLS